MFSAFGFPSSFDGKGPAVSPQECTEKAAGLMQPPRFFLQTPHRNAFRSRTDRQSSFGTFFYAIPLRTVLWYCCLPLKKMTASCKIPRQCGCPPSDRSKVVSSTRAAGAPAARATAALKRVGASLWWNRTPVFLFFPPRALTLPVSVAPSPGGQWASNSNALTLSLTSFLTA